MASSSSTSSSFTFLLISFLLLSSYSLADNSLSGRLRTTTDHSRPCDEVYVVAEGETLHTISDRCGDPFIVEQNPHIQDPDDVFPGLVIKITPFISNKLARKVLTRF